MWSTPIVPLFFITLYKLMHLIYGWVSIGFARTTLSCSLSASELFEHGGAPCHSTGTLDGACAAKRTAQACDTYLDSFGIMFEQATQPCVHIQYHC